MQDIDVGSGFVESSDGKGAMQDESLNYFLTEEETADLAFPYARPPQVSYSGQDFDVEGLVRRLKRGDIVIPSFGDTDEDIETAGFQRGFVWRKPQMDRFIESLLLGYPIPGIFLVRQSDNRMLVLDGQQRLRTLLYFYSGILNDRVFKLNDVSDDFKGVTYESLSEEARRNLDNTFIQATIVTAQPDADNMDAIYQIFERLNSGGTQLTAHEIRVALYAGEVIDYLEILNRDAAWRGLYGKKNARIRDQELIARIIALYLRSDEYSRPLKTFINSFLDENRPNVREETKNAGDLFLRTSEKLREVFGPESLRRASRQVNNAWTDALYFGVMRRLATSGDISRDELKIGYAQLRESDEFQQVSTGPSADDYRVKKRLQLAEEAFANNE